MQETIEYMTVGVCVCEFYEKIIFSDSFRARILGWRLCLEYPSSFKVKMLDLVIRQSYNPTAISSLQIGSDYQDSTVVNMRPHKCDKLLNRPEFISRRRDKSKLFH